MPAFRTRRRRALLRLAAAAAGPGPGLIDAQTALALALLRVRVLVLVPREDHAHVPVHKRRLVQLLARPHTLPKLHAVRLRAVLCAQHRHQLAQLRLFLLLRALPPSPDPAGMLTSNADAPEEPITPDHASYAVCISSLTSSSWSASSSRAVRYAFAVSRADDVFSAPEGAGDPAFISPSASASALASEAAGAGAGPGQCNWCGCCKAEAVGKGRGTRRCGRFGGAERKAASAGGHGRGRGVESKARARARARRG
jgi:hypothetical protein